MTSGVVFKSSLAKEGFVTGFTKETHSYFVNGLF